MLWFCTAYDFVQWLNPCTALRWFSVVSLVYTLSNPFVIDQGFVLNCAFFNISDAYLFFIHQISVAMVVTVNRLFTTALDFHTIHLDPFMNGNLQDWFSPICARPLNCKNYRILFLLAIRNKPTGLISMVWEIGWDEIYFHDMHETGGLKLAKGSGDCRPERLDVFERSGTDIEILRSWRPGR